MVSHVNNKCLLRTGRGGRMQCNLDIQILSELIAILGAQTHCNLALVQCFVERELVVFWVLGLFLEQ